MHRPSLVAALGFALIARVIPAGRRCDSGRHNNRSGLAHPEDAAGDTILAGSQEIDVPAGNGSPQPSLKLNHFTMAAWIKLTQTDTHEANWEVVEKNASYWLEVTNGNDLAAFPAKPTDPHYTLRCGGYFGPDHAYSYADSNVMLPHGVDAAWTHVACTYDGAYLTVYINGEQRGRVPVSGTTEANDNNLTVGGNDKPEAGGQWTTSPRHNFLGGAMDDFRLYNRPLTATDIATLVRRRGSDPSPSPSP